MKSITLNQEDINLDFQKLNENGSIEKKTESIYIIRDTRSAPTSLTKQPTKYRITKEHDKDRYYLINRLTGSSKIITEKPPTEVTPELSIEIVENEVIINGLAGTLQLINPSLLFWRRVNF